MNKKNLGIGGLVALIISIVFGINVFTPESRTSEYSAHTTTQLSPQQSSIQHQQYSETSQSNIKIEQAFAQKQQNVEVEGSGTVKAILKDDNQGSRHQKFILNLSNGQTVLVAHNIDLAPRIDSLKKGDIVVFKGDYEYSEKGGVIHWTHRDPNGHHTDGWLKHDGKIYQ
ncbi:DUF3465 domain-containing protein [Acinetobacter qingfengensis]|uniref:Uncharacterized protein n=1 Tax=Acinetobacter qingfengensis TaxID=1262585 RepID=A0A1E7REA7_9GAMM|nr:DUF3465 domain-containing protein [Acinetobacter qingfengensis]KAA8735018.1 DUF3465 domain-containing protein [Acinetobacter qingfengensis]OEY97740.1 hypothetical protein BJI46_08275 [Acinetobacter qingfengensis]